MACSPVSRGGRAFQHAPEPRPLRRSLHPASCYSRPQRAVERLPRGPSLLMRAAEIRGSVGSSGAQAKQLLTSPIPGWESKVVWGDRDKRCLSYRLSEAPLQVSERREPEVILRGSAHPGQAPAHSLCPSRVCSYREGTRVGLGSGSELPGSL